MKRITNKIIPISIIALLATGISLSTRQTSFSAARAEEIGDYGDAVRMPSMSFYGDT